MSFVVDTDVCSAYLRGNRAVQARFMQYGSGIYVSAVAVGELFTWAYRKGNPAALAEGVIDLLNEAKLLPLDLPVAKLFGEMRAEMLDRGIAVAVPDLLIAATAMQNNFTVVTHNTRHFSMVPNLRLQDWLVP